MLQTYGERRKEYFPNLVVPAAGNVSAQHIASVTTLTVGIVSQPCSSMFHDLDCQAVIS